MQDNPPTFPLPVVGFAAYSGSGKTTLLEQVIGQLRQQGLRPGVIKFSHHDVTPDAPGKDSDRLRKAGASQTLLTCPQRAIRIQEFDQHHEPSLQQSIEALQLDQLDLVLVEGFRDQAFDKIEVHRRGAGKPLLYPHDHNIIAIATDDLTTDHPIPLLDLNSPHQVTDFICRRFL